MITSSSSDREYNENHRSYRDNHNNRDDRDDRDNNGNSDSSDGRGGADKYRNKGKGGRLARTYPPSGQYDKIEDNTYSDEDETDYDNRSNRNNNNIINKNNNNSSNNNNNGNNTNNKNRNKIDREELDSTLAMQTMSLIHGQLTAMKHQLLTISDTPPEYSMDVSRNQRPGQSYTNTRNSKNSYFIFFM